MELLSKILDYSNIDKAYRQVFVDLSIILHWVMDLFQLTKKTKKASIIYEFHRKVSSE